jgi:hypothetical protein
VLTEGARKIYHGRRVGQGCSRGINDFKRGYQPSSNLVKGENGDLLADSAVKLCHCGYRVLLSQDYSDLQESNINTSLRRMLR